MKTSVLPFVLFILLVFAAGRTSQAQTPSPIAQASALAASHGKLPPPHGQIDIANEPIVKIVANVQPAVVNITAQETVPEYYTGYNQYFELFRGVRNHTEQSIGFANYRFMPQMSGDGGEPLPIRYRACPRSKPATSPGAIRATSARMASASPP